MLSFELSAIDLILGIAVVILLVLYTRERPGRHALKETFSLKKLRSTTLPQETGEVASSDTSSTKPSTCPGQLGYLGNLPDGAPLPDDCLGCFQIVECLGSEE